jgi:hypothetical protein
VHRLQGLVDVAGDHVLVLAAVDLQRQVQRPALVLQQVFLVDAGIGGIAEGDLGRLAGALDARHRAAVVADINTVGLLEVREHMLHEPGVEVVAAELVVAVAGQDLGDIAAHAHHGDVEGAAPEVIDQDRTGALVVGLVGERRGGGLIDDAHDLQARQLAGIARGLALGIGEVGRHRDHGLLDRAGPGPPRRRA